MTSEKPDIKTSNRILPLQAIRGIAFMMIFLSHANVVWSNWGGCGVSIFYVLSGFVMIYTYYTKELDTSFRESFKFSLKKIKKLYPLHILTMCAAILLECIGIIKGFSIIEVIKMCIKIVPNMFLIQAWVPTSSIYFSLNGVAWYLSVLLILYMAFPLLLALIKKNDSEKKAIICMGATFIIQVIVTMLTLNIKGIDDKQTFSTWITYICPLFRLGDFFIGCNAGYLFLKHRNND